MKLLFMPALLLLTMAVSCNSGLDLRENTPSKCQAPDWYAERNTAATVDNDKYIGYGEGRTEELAHVNAVQAMSKGLEIESNSLTLCRLTTYAQGAINRCTRELEVASKNKFSEVDTVDSDKDKYCNRHYIKLSYDLASMTVKIARKITDEGRQVPLNCPNNNAVRNSTTFANELLFDLRATGKWGDKNCIPDWQLRYKDGRWLVAIENQQVLVLEQDLVSLFFPTFSTESSFALNLPEDARRGQAFTIKVTLAREAREYSYFSMIVVEPTGNYVVLMRNKSVGNLTEIPYSSLYGHTNIIMTFDKELYVGMLCKDRLDFSEGHLLSTDQNRGPWGEVLNNLDTWAKQIEDGGKGCVYNGQLLKKV